MALTSEETETFQPFETVGTELEDFGSIRILNLLTPFVCEPCEQPSDDCTGCYGMVMLSHIEEQIGQSGIEHMTLLAQAWGADED